MLQECWVDGVPVFYSPTGWYGVAKGKTDDGKFIFEASYSVTYYVKNTDVFEICNCEDNNSIYQAAEAMKNTICPYKYIIDEYMNYGLEFDAAYKEISDMKIPEGIKPEAPVVEYFNKYKEAFIALINAYSEKYKNEKEFIINFLTEYGIKAGSSKWNSSYIRWHGKEILRYAGVQEDIVEALSTEVLKYVCESDITFGKIKLFDNDVIADAFVREENRNGFATSKHRVNGFLLCCSRVVIAKPCGF